MDSTTLLGVLDEVVVVVRRALDDLADWGLEGSRPHQYRSDLVADRAALEVLTGNGLGVLSEESGITNGDSPITVVIDPVDGSTNASRGIPWFATSLCAVDADGPLVALVVNQATGERFHAVRGGGAFRNGVPMAPSPVESMRSAIVGMSGMPQHYFGWNQFRVLGAAALDLCAVACGRLDAYIDCSRNAHGVWDYLGGLLVCTEAGAVVGEVDDRPLCVLEHDARRTPVAASTPALLVEALAARRAFT